MTLSLHFHGAASTVTGSCYRIVHDQGQLLVDCGLFQGNKSLRELNYGDFPFDPRQIDAVLLTHAHIDHSGLLPKLLLRGFDGKVFATTGTRDLLTYMLPDSGYIQESAVRRLNRRNRRRGVGEVTPIYTKADAQTCLDRIQPVSLNEWSPVARGVEARYWNAGHILGAAAVEVRVGGKTLLFSGDIGPDEHRFHEDPSGPQGVDFLILEATYGDRERDDLPLSDRTARLGMEINEALAAGGNLLIPAFAVERTQELLYAIAVLLEQGTISPARVYLDSPLAIRATEVFARHCGELIDTPDAAELFAHPHFHFLQDADASRALARISGGVIIVAASGMCDAGRIRHHLKNNLWRRDATVLFIGYQVPGTLGHLILSGRRRVRIEGEEIEVNARIRRMDQYYSAHADASELVAYATNRMPIKCGVFLTHGESSALAALAARLRTTLAESTPVMIPALDERADLEAPQMQLEKQSLRPLAADLTDADWHNDFAEFSLALRQQLRELRSDGERRHLLAALQRLLARSE